MPRFCWLLVGVLLLPSLSQAMVIDTSLGVGYLKGDTQYEIGGLVVDASGSTALHFPISRLEFPLDAWMLKGEVALKAPRGWTLNLQGQTNLTGDAGKMKDSDWGVFEVVDPNRLDVYSESDTDKTLLILDASLDYRFAPVPYQGSGAENLLFTYFAGVGYKYQKFEFDNSNADQWYPSVPSQPHDFMPGLGLTYDIQYNIPYLKAGFDLTHGFAGTLSLSASYSPVLNLKDEDNHLLRGKRNVADHGWDGTAWGVSAEYSYDLTPCWHVGVEFAGYWLQSNGRADAYFDGVWDHSIEHRVKSSQVSGFLSLGRSF